MGTLHIKNTCIQFQYFQSFYVAVVQSSGGFREGGAPGARPPLRTKISLIS